MGIDAAKWVLTHRWAIMPEMLETIISLAAGDTDPEKAKALLTRDGEPLPGARRAEVLDRVAIIPVVGPIFPRANIFTAFSGGTSVQMLAKDFTAAMENQDVDAVIFNHDSPGGELTGVSELAGMIYAARGRKPIISYGYGLVASADYWIAAAADRIVTSDTAVIGSIGVIVSGVDTKRADEKIGVQRYSIVSSRSPKKRLDPLSDEGRAEIQSLVDQAADVMLGSIAKYRGTTVENILDNYGEGGVKGAELALKSGMIDAIGTLEGEIDRLKKSATNQFFPFLRGESSMTIEELKAKHPETYQAILSIGKNEGIAEGRTKGLDEGKALGVSEGRKQGAESERARIKAIRELSVAGSEEIVQNAIDSGATPEATAMEIVKAQKGQAGAAMAADLAGGLAAAEQVRQIAGKNQLPGNENENLGAMVAAVQEFNKSR